MSHEIEPKMKVKHFHIRVNKDHIQHDEDTLNVFMETVKVHRTAQQLVTTTQANFWSILVFFSEASMDGTHLSKSSNKQPAFDPASLNDEERNRYEALRMWRTDEAAKDGYPSYIVASNAQLGAIAQMNPSSKEELSSLKGFGERKVDRYGDDIIALLNSI